MALDTVALGAPYRTADENAKGKSMSILEAKQKFRDSQERSDGFRKLAKLLIETGFQAPFQNDSYLDALALTQAMFDSTQHSMRIMSGKAGDGFLTELSDSLRAALVRVREAGGNVKVILLNGELTANLIVLQQEFKDTFQILKARTSSPVQHFIICDKKMLRVEEIHQDIADDSPADLIQAKVYFNNPSRARMMEDVFDTIWSKLSNKAIERSV